MIVSDVLPASWRDVFDPNARQIGIGVDPATTTKKKSNPTGIALVQRVGLSFYARLALRFKTSDPDVTTAVLRELVTGLPHGLRVRRVCILATNERFYAASLRRAFAGLVPVEQLIESEKTTYLGEEMLVKSYLGNLLVNTLEDGYLPLPDLPWVSADLRQPYLEQGRFCCDVDESGNHGDLFSALGPALHAVSAKGGPAEASAVQVGQFGRAATAVRKLFNQFAGRHGGGGVRLHT